MWHNFTTKMKFCFLYSCGLRPITQAMELASSLNGSNTSLLYSAPTLTLPYISVISLASVVGTLGNLLVIGSICGSIRRRNPRTVGKIFIVNLACSDLIVTSVINPVAVTGKPRDGRDYKADVELLVIIKTRKRGNCECIAT